MTSQQTSEKKPVLGAFAQQTDDGDRIEGKYNVWRYDTPSTYCVAFGIEATSREHAMAMAMEKIND